MQQPANNTSVVVQHGNNEGAELEYAIRKTVQTSGKADEHKLMI